MCGCMYVYACVYTYVCVYMCECMHVCCVLYVCMCVQSFAYHNSKVCRYLKFQKRK